MFMIFYFACFVYDRYPSKLTIKGKIKANFHIYTRFYR